MKVHNKSIYFFRKDYLEEGGGGEEQGNEDFFFYLQKTHKMHSLKY